MVESVLDQVGADEAGSPGDEQRPHEDEQHHENHENKTLTKSTNKTKQQRPCFDIFVSFVIFVDFTFPDDQIHEGYSFQEIT